MDEAGSILESSRLQTDFVVQAACESAWNECATSKELYGDREHMTFLVDLYVQAGTLMKAAQTIHASRKLFVDCEPFCVCSFQDIDQMEEQPPTPLTPVKGPEEQDKASTTQAERESEDKLSDTKAARTKEVGSFFQFADHSFS